MTPRDFDTSPINSELTALNAWKRELMNASNRFQVSLVDTAGRLRMKPDWDIEGVRLPTHLFYCVVEGAFEAQVDSVKRRLNRGDLLWAAPGTPLWFRLIAPTPIASAPLVVLRFRLDARHSDGQRIASPHTIRIFSPTAGTQFLMERLVELACAPASNYDAEAVRAYLLTLHFELERTLSPSPPRGVLTATQCEAIRRHLATSHGQWQTPTALARVVELSPPYFTRLFTRTFARSPRRFLLEERIRFAGVRLLESSASVSAIASELGYADVFAFSRQFKAVQGQSPSVYRRSHVSTAGFNRRAN